MLISGFQKSSLIDYSEKISAIIFTQGCNFKCPYCHNPELNEFNMRETEFSVSRILDFLKTRVGKLDGVVITGGEPTIHKDLPEFIKQIKAMGFCVKLDSNGTNPEMLEDLINTKLIDYIAMDIKGPLEKYEEIVCTKVNIENIKKSIDLLKTSSIECEFRTTVVKSQLTSEDFEKIGELLDGLDRYYLQKFLPTKTLNKFYINQTTYTNEEFEPIIQSLTPYIKEIILR